MTDKQKHNQVGDHRITCELRDKKHTPGPWETVPYKTGLRTYWIIRNKEWGGLNPSTKSNVLQTENAADAHLIAAAPDLLAALKELVHQIWLGKPQQNLLPAYNKAQDTIAKAKGIEVSP